MTPAVGMERRRLLTASLAAFASYALLGEARAAAAITDRRLTAKRWIERQRDLAAALRDGTLAPAAWNAEVTRMAGEVEIEALMAEARRGRIGDANTPFMRDPVKRRIRFVDDDGVPRSLGYGAALFTFGPGNVITPHAHRHMASAHLIIEGKLRIRTFDRVGDGNGAIIIRPARDTIGGVGTAAAMTSAKDNIHWFVPASPRAMTFDVIIDGLDPGAADYVIEPVDPLGGTRRSDGTIVAPILDFAESMRRYPADR